MKTARTIMYVIFVYLFLMIVVSVSPDVISVISDGAETAHVETKSDEITTVNEMVDETEAKQTELPFDFSVNVITETEAEEETAVEYETPYPPIHRAEPNDLTAVVIGELDKRKKTIIYLCRRRFCRLRRHKKEV